MEADIQFLEDIIQKKLAEKYAFLRVVDVIMKREEYFKGEPMLFIDVVIDAKHEDIDFKALSGVEEMIRPVLRENDEGAFPVFSFMSRRDAKVKYRDAARPH